MENCLCKNVLKIIKILYNTNAKYLKNNKCHIYKRYYFDFTIFLINNLFIFIFNWIDF